MCGFFGALFERSYNVERRLKLSGSLIDHRGPDSQHSWYAEDHIAFLYHARLSIFDLSPNAEQPMVSSCGRYVLAYNGEIYNYKNIQHRVLSSLGFDRSTGDTRILVELISKVGIKDAIKLLDGMFAFAVYDLKNSSLTLARDRIGEKPLYYSLQEVDGVNALVFGSQIKSIQSFTDNKNIREDSVSLFKKYGYIPEPYSIYENVFKLKPAHYIEYTFNKDRINKNIIQKPYWSLLESFEKQTIVRDINSSKPFHEIVETFNSIFEETIQTRCASDVDVGTFLSGGIDSTLVTANAKKFLQNNIHTFSVGYDDKNYDEGAEAEKVADFLGTIHHNIKFAPEDAGEILLESSRAYDEPFADASQLPTLFLSKYASNYVKVVLSGDGGDELFGGYNRYLFADRFWNKIKLIPYGMRVKISNYLQNNSELVQMLIKYLLPRYANVRDFKGKLKKVCQVLLVDNEFEFYESIISTFEAGITIGENPLIEFNNASLKNAEINSSFPEYMMLMDILTYLPGDLLVKVDRASMYYGLEVRAPFLSNALVEFSNSISVDQKIRNGVAKPILRESLKGFIPRNLFDRPKMGFGVPISDWMRNELFQTFECLFDLSKMTEIPTIDNELVVDLWKRHLSGDEEHGYKLWNYVSLRLWYDSTIY